MATIEQQLKQLRFIRSLRADSLKRQERAAELACQQTHQQIMQAEQDIAQLEEGVITLQRESLRDLVSGNLVRVERLLSFNQDKLKGMKRVIDAKVELDGLVHHKHAADKQHAQVRAQATRAEKKVIGLDEVIVSKSWK